MALDSPLLRALCLTALLAACSDPVVAGASDGGARDTSIPLDAPIGDGATPDAMVPAIEIDPCAEWESVFPADAFEVTPARSGELQTLLDTHGTIRLVSGGDYRTGGPATVRVSDDQAILSLGHSRFPDVVVAAGTEGARVRGIREASIRFEPGEVSRLNCFMSIVGWGGIQVQGASVERTSFINFSQTDVQVDTSMGGFFRDNRFIKINSHGAEAPVRLVGDSTRASGGNVFFLYDALSSSGSPFLVEGQSDVTFVGINAEGYNERALTDQSWLFRVRDTGTFRGADFVGIARGAGPVYPMFDLDAETIYLHRVGTGMESPQVILNAGVQTFVSWENGWDDTFIDDRATDGTRFHILENEDEPAAVLDGAELMMPPAANEAVAHALADERPGRPWLVPTFPAIPDPTGADWEAQRDMPGRLDERAAIQALLDSPDGVASLEPRTYYVGGPLVMGASDRLVGAGMGHTAIVALDPNDDLVHVEWGDPASCNVTTADFTVAELTLQGGARGIDSSFPGTQVNNSILSHVAFRDMSVAGIHIHGAYAWDNNFLDHLDFVDCGFGLLQEGQDDPGTCPGPGWLTMSYMDKVVFYRNQFVRCGQAMAFRPTRGNNLDAIVESRFVDNDGPAIELTSGNDGTMIASCAFENNDADPIIVGPATVLNSLFVADRGRSMVGPFTDVEGCTFRRGTSPSATIFTNIVPGYLAGVSRVNVVHCDSDMPLGAVEDSAPIAGLYLDNAMPADEPFQELMTVLDYRTQHTQDVADDTRAIHTILTGEPSPGSRLLFSRAETTSP